MLVLGFLGIVLFFFKKKKVSFLREEKWLCWIFIGYLGAYLLSAVVNSTTGVLEEIRGKHFEKEAYLLLFLPIFYLFRSLKIPRWALWYGLCIGGILVGCYSLAEFGWVSIGERVRGAYNPIMFGCLSLAIAFMSIQSYQFFEQHHRAFLILPISGFFLGTVSSVLTGSRGAWVAAPILFLVTLVHLGKRIKKKMLFIIVSVFVLAFLVPYLIPNTNLAQRIELVGENFLKYSKGNVDALNGIGLRLASWEASWNIAKEHLLLGIGPGGYYPTIQKMSSRGELPYYVGVYYNQPHSIYFAVLVDSGLVGLFFLLALFFVPLWIFVKRIRAPGMDKSIDKTAHYTGVILILGYSQFGLTETIFGRNLFVSFYIIMLAALLQITSEESVQTRKVRENER